MDIPVIHELDDSLEATGSTYRFCGNACANQFNMGSLHPLDQYPRWSWGKEGRDTALDGERCMGCGLEINATKEND
jgi:hypothetical protein